MSDVPGEIWLEFLVRLPVVDLLRFRCVSKPWKSLIDSNEFTRLHLNQSLNTNSNLNIIFKHSNHIYSIDFDSIIETNQTDFHDLDYPLMTTKLGVGIKLFGSCHGLLVLSNCETIVLWNPSIRRFHELPNESFECLDIMIHGFGYDVVSDDYKLVRMVQGYGGGDVVVRVYSLKSDSWKRIPDLPYYLNEKGGEGVYVNGALHWRVGDKQIANLLIAFDLGTEEFRLVAIPGFAVGKRGIVVYVLGGCLSLKFNFNKDHVDIWVMKEYGVDESWSLLFRFDVDSGFKTFDVVSGYEWVRPIAYSKCNKKVLVRLKNGELTWYDLDKKSTDSLMVEMPGTTSHELCTCVQSLVLFNNGTCDFNLETVTNTSKKQIPKAKKLKNVARRNEYEMQKLFALNEKQKLVLQRKTEEAALATKRLKESLESKKTSHEYGVGDGGGSGIQALMQTIEHELEVTVGVHEVRAEHKRQMEERARMAKELAELKEEARIAQQGELSFTESMSPGARNARIFALEDMLATSSSVLVTMASHLSEGEECERAFSGRGRWNQVRNLTEAKRTMSFIFNLASSSRCNLKDREVDCRDKDSEIRDLKEKVVELLRQTDLQKAEIIRQEKLLKCANGQQSNEANSDEGYYGLRPKDMVVRRGKPRGL